jgi:hypothetical protein
MAIREGLWDCQWCGQAGILGRHKECSQCGRSRPEGTKFYLPGNAPAVTDKKLLDIAQVGPDWLCEHCSSSNSNDRTHCAHCNAPRGSSPSQAVKDHATAAVPQSGDNAPAEPPPATTQPLAYTAQPAVPTRRAIPVAFLIGIAALCLCGFIFTSLLRTNSSDAPTFPPPTSTPIVTPTPTIPPYHEITATVSGFQWAWVISIERLTAVTQTGPAVPLDGRLLSQAQVIDHYVQVLDHYDTLTTQIPEQVQVGTNTYVCGQRDLGNGFFEDIQCTDPIYETRYRIETSQQPVYRDDPVYVTQYTYEIDQWVYAREERASGTDQEPYWPAVTLADDEREGSRSQWYEVRFNDAAGNLYTWVADESEWHSFALGNLHHLEVNDFGFVYQVLD